MSVVIRTAVSADQRQCLAFIAALRSEPVQPGWAGVFESLILGHRGTALVAEHDERGLLGVVTLSFNLAVRFCGEYCQVEELFVGLPPGTFSPVEQWTWNRSSTRPTYNSVWSSPVVAYWFSSVSVRSPSRFKLRAAYQ